MARYNHDICSNHMNEWQGEMSMLKSEKQKAMIYELLLANNRITVHEVMESLHISESTVRRLFNSIEEDEKAIRIHGGLQLVQNSQTDYSFINMSKQHTQEKIRIGDCALQFIKSSEAIYLDGGTTIMQLANSIAGRVESGQLKDLMVVTNSYAIVELLSPYCKIILIGGEYRSKRMDFAGAISERLVKSMQFQKCFLGADGIDLTEGLMVTDVETAALNEIILKHSAESYILADSSKFLEKSFMPYGSIYSITHIITDLGLDENIQKRFKEKKISYSLA